MKKLHASHSSRGHAPWTQDRAFDTPAPSPTIPTTQRSIVQSLFPTTSLSPLSSAFFFKPSAPVYLPKPRNHPSSAY
ncbi:hypothetical protein M407DRAFT_188398 [Tulasnella calospora MUT 4182]|uniref:Uncharacterized protein n=1 Tax=Tulasnella calospora MUT 4182 TaxID=1051891 RepID=A0A0C3Q283_9AGAM|nr:hypothetical protein M407DRAFT_188398 [Tulasnella calospora MUT 4182]